MIQSFTRSTWFASAAMLFILALGAAPQSWAQIREEEEEEPILITEDELNQLLVWYVDGKYEKVLFKAIRYTEDDDQKKHPVPYLYMAKAYLAIHNSDDSDLRESYEVDKMKALKNALKYAGKFVKKDKEQEFVPEEQEYIEDLRKETIIAAETEMDNGKFTKAKSYYKYLWTLDAEDPGAWLMYGSVLWKAKAVRDAQESWNTAEQLLIEYGGKGLEEVQQDLLKYAVIYTAEMLADEGNRTDARKWIEATNELFGTDREVQAVLRSL